MDILEAIKNRHSVRAYTNQNIEGQIKEELISYINQCNKESGLHMQLIDNDQKAFDGFMAHYGKFSNVRNYIAVVGKKNCEEQCGYYGEKVVLRLQQLGLNSCWVGLSYKKNKDIIEVCGEEKIHLVIAIGYGVTQGTEHKTKSKEKVVGSIEGKPDWFMKGIECALLAPTAMNQQKFSFSLNDNEVTVKAGFGPYSKVDLGIVKYHFQIGAGIHNFIWK